MWGIIDTRYPARGDIGVLRGKSKTYANAFKKRRKIYTKLIKFMNNSDTFPIEKLTVQKLIGTIKLGASVGFNQIER